MKRSVLYLCVGAAGITLGGAWYGVHAWRMTQRVALVQAGLPVSPEPGRLSHELVAALQVATEAVKPAADSAEPLGRLAELYYANGFNAEAKQGFEALRQLEPQNARWPYLLADLRIRTGHAADAVPDLWAAVKLAPDYPAAWIRLGDLLVEEGQLKQAGRCYEQAVAVAPENLWAAFALISFEAWHGQRSDQRLRLLELSQAHPDIQEFHALLARLHSAAGDPARATEETGRAERARRRLSMEDPWIEGLAQLCLDHARLSALAERLRRDGRLTGAEPLFKRAIELAPGESGLRGSLAELYVEMDRPADARAVLETAIKAFPDDPNVPERLSHVLRIEHKPGEALAAATQALVRWPANALLQAARGFALRDAHEIEDAVGALREAVRLDPMLVEAHYSLGFCLIGLGQRDAAKIELERAMALRPDYPDVLVLLGTLAIEAGDLESAERTVGRLYALQPDVPGARLLYASLQLDKGKAADKAGRLDEAARCFGAGLEASPNLGSLLAESSSIAMRRGAYGEAVEFLQRYLLVEPSNIAAYASLGEALLETDRPADARKILLKGRALASNVGTPAQVDEFTLLLQRTRR